VIYMTGERRLYDRNFRRPYSPFLTPDSTVDNLVFRLPFLPVPGNHDYYDLGGWAMWLSRVPIIGSGLRALVHELFAFSVPEGGSDMGRAYMTAFMDPDAKTRDTSAPLPYRPGERTRLPNRYYQFRVGGADFFALDSNTLDAPPPEAVDAAQVKQAAQERIQLLQKRSDKMDAELRRRQRERDRLRAETRAQTARDPGRRTALQERLAHVAHDFAALRAALESSLAATTAVPQSPRTAMPARTPATPWPSPSAAGARRAKTSPPLPPMTRTR
jgi:hypothetical protein